MKVNLFILGLGKDVDTIKLLELFALYGTVDAVHLPADKKTGKLMGYGFVQMTDKAGAERAIEALNDREFNGRKLTVRVADKKEKSGTPGPKKTAPPIFKDKTGPQTGERKKRPRKLSNVQTN